MKNKDIATVTLAAGAVSVAAAKAVADEKPNVDAAAVDKAFETLKTYDWGADRNALKPIDQAIIATHGDAAARKALEERLVEVLTGDASRSAKDFVCRKLRTVGTARSVKALAGLLRAEETSHIARYALERIPDDKALDAMRDALPKVSNKLKAGIIGSLGVRRDEKSVRAIAKFLGDSDVLVARAAAHSLGLVGSLDAAKALHAFAGKAPANMKLPVADARLACAEQLLADGKKSDAVSLYKALKSEDQPKHVNVAAMKGMLAAAAKK